MPATVIVDWVGITEDVLECVHRHRLADYQVGPSIGKDFVMRKLGTLVLVVSVIALSATTASARDAVISLPISEALSTADAKSMLGDNIKFYFGNQPHAQIVQDLGSVTTNRKTNAFMKSDETACNWVFLSALIALRDRAIEMGADAVTNIKSNYKHNESSSETTFKCGAGNVVAGVALKGTIVKLGK